MLDLSLYLVASKAQNQSDEAFLNIIKEAIKGGVSIVQLREKTMPSRDFYELALKLKELCGEFQIPFIINDRIDIALATNASGVHLGQEDLPVSVARKFLGEKKIIGLSVKRLSQLDNINGADYLGCGAICATPTKKESEILSLEHLAKITSLSPLPVVAIGGIDEEVAQRLKGLNLAGIAVVRAIMNSKNPYQTALNLKALSKSL